MSVSSLLTGAPPTAHQPGRLPALDAAARLRRRGGRLVATGGCFDLLHPGHLSLLRQARALGNTLVVCVNSDESVRRRKGPDRPIVPAADRIALLEALEPVDTVIMFEEDTPPCCWRRCDPTYGSKVATTPSPTCPKHQWCAGTAGRSCSSP